MSMLHYASVYGKKGGKTNPCDPGLTRTNLGGEVMSAIMISGAAGTIGGAAREACRLETLGPDGVTGTYSSKEIIHPWWDGVR